MTVGAVAVNSTSTNSAVHVMLYIHIRADSMLKIIFLFFPDFCWYSVLVAVRCYCVVVVMVMAGR